MLTDAERIELLSSPESSSVRTVEEAANEPALSGVNGWGWLGKRRRGDPEAAVDSGGFNKLLSFLATPAPTYPSV